MAIGVRLLGAPSIRDGGEWRDVRLDKRLALLTYLVCAEGWVSRERLSYLFWPDVGTSQARINLRQLLVRVRSLPFDIVVEADDQRLRWAPENDVTAFRQAIGSADWSAAMAHYRGELVDGLIVEEATEFTDWLEFERSQLRELQRQAVLHQAEAAQTAGRPEEAAALYERLLSQDPLDEGVVQALLGLLVRLGAVEEARRRLQGFAARLQEQLGFDPSTATESIVVEGATRQATAAPAESEPTGDTPVRHIRLAAPLTKFVGRDEELAATVARLSSEGCRLLTVVGVGGVGKTRLALEVARRLVQRFADGFVAVPLHRVTSAEAVPLSLAAALGLELRGLKSPLDQLIDYLEPRQLLLLLDNFEHLPEAVLLVQELLSSCPGLKVLVTSRQRLKLQAEWLQPLGGLPVPPPVPPSVVATPGGLEESRAFDALVLLETRARQVEPTFTIAAANLPKVVELCRLLEGLPLGIELAAGWLRGHDLDQVLAALGAGLDVVSSDTLDTAERHRTLKVVIEHSWNLLSTVERQALRSLAVFPRGFDRAAARSVVGVSPPVLSALVEKSMLRRAVDERYDAHPLIQRFLEAQLAELPSEKERLVGAHASFYLNVMAAWAGRLHGPQQPAMLAQFTPDYDNLTTAWLTAIDRGWVAECLAAVDPLVLFHGIQGRFTEGQRLFAASVASMRTQAEQGPANAILLATLRANLAWFMAALARFEAAAAEARAALDLVASVGHAPVEVRALQVLGSIASRLGDDVPARGYLEKSLALAEASGDRWAIGLVSGQVGLLALRTGQHAAAKAHFERSLAINEALGNTPGVVNALDYLGRLSLATGDTAPAVASFERGIALAEGSHFRLRLPYLMTQLATARLLLGHMDDAATVASDALVIAEELGQRALQAEALAILGRSATDRDQKLAYFARALVLASELGETPRTLDLLLDFAQFEIGRVRATTLLRLVSDHPAARPAQRERAQALFVRRAAGAPTDTCAAGSEAADDHRPNLEETVRLLLT